jgi:phage shock protein A
VSTFSRIWNYIKAAFGAAAEERMDPAIQIEQSVAEARRQDLELRSQAARVIAHRSEVQMRLDRAVEESAKAKEQAGQALRNAEAASAKGDTAEAERWMRAAQSLAMRLESSESLVESLKGQYRVAMEQAQGAKAQVDDNAMRLEGLVSRRMELMGKLQQAKMQEEVNKTLEALHRPMEATGPSFEQIEDKINRRMALASATSELESTGLSGAQMDVERSVQEMGAQKRLDALRQELGLGAPAASSGEISEGTAATSSGEGEARH